MVNYFSSLMDISWWLGCPNNVETNSETTQNTHPCLAHKQNKIQFNLDYVTAVNEYSINFIHLAHLSFHDA